MGTEIDKMTEGGHSNQRMMANRKREEGGGGKKRTASFSLIRRVRNAKES